MTAQGSVGLEAVSGELAGHERAAADAARETALADRTTDAVLKAARPTSARSPARRYSA
jgi:hypothetical protein